MQYIPNRVDTLLLAGVKKVAQSLKPSGSNHLFGGALGPVSNVTYNGKTYQLWTAKEGTNARVKLALNNKVFAVVTTNDFPADAKTNFGKLVGDGNNLAGSYSVSSGKNATLPAPSIRAQFRAAQATLVADQAIEVQDMEAGKCLVLGACFRGNVKLETGDG